MAQNVRAKSHNAKRQRFAKGCGLAEPPGGPGQVSLAARHGSQCAARPCVKRSGAASIGAGAFSEITGIERPTHTAIRVANSNSERPRCKCRRTVPRGCWFLLNVGTSRVFAVETGDADACDFQAIDGSCWAFHKEPRTVERKPDSPGVGISLDILGEILDHVTDAEEDEDAAPEEGEDAQASGARRRRGQDLHAPRAATTTKK
eukprot:g19901.t1